MRTEEITVTADDGTPLHVYHWSSDTPSTPRAVVHIAHGMAEHAARYARLAEALVAAGYEVYANDHRGHGKTARTEADLGFFAASNGWRRVVDDLWLHIRTARERHAGVPVVLIGHSMGSFISQQVIIEHGDALAAAVLSGSNGKPPAIAAAGRVVARIERMRLGAHGRSKLLNALSFDDYNKAFRPNRTKFDWLSRDQAEVDKYVADPLCGFMVCTQLWVDLLDVLGDIASPAKQARISPTLPVYIVAGSEDPVGAQTRGLEQLRGAYAAAGLTRVAHRYYPGGRHEIFNETNRDEVTRDLIAWLDGALPKA
ncbi:MAG: alpha/beta hydrolase [Deltaproteobacteria bacterium]